MRNKITVTQKRWLLSAHLFCTVAWLGAGLCSLVFNITALITNDPHLLSATYMLASALDKAMLRGGAIGMLITGILLSVLTHWGLFRFYWIIVKEIFTLIAIVVGFLISGWNEHALSLTMIYGLQALDNPLYTMDRALMFIGIVFEIISLSGIIIISIFKPWGQRKRPASRRTQNASTHH